MGIEFLFIRYLKRKHRCQLKVVSLVKFNTQSTKSGDGTEGLSLVVGSRNVTDVLKFLDEPVERLRYKSMRGGESKRKLSRSEKQYGTWVSDSRCISSL